MDLSEAVKNGNVGVVELLLAQDPSLVTATNDVGMTCLHLAAAHGHHPLVKMLPEKIDVGVRDSHGCTPLHVAAFNGRTDAIPILLVKGADPNQRSNAQLTPMHLAAQNNEGHTPLESAIFKGKTPNQAIADWIAIERQR